MIHCLDPFKIQRSPFFSARVFKAAASEPECGSESAKAPASASPETRRSTYLDFCASVPNLAMSSAHILVTAITTEVDAQAAEISIIAKA